MNLSLNYHPNRFHNGEEFYNSYLSHRVSDIHEYVMMAAPVDGEYQLVYGSTQGIDWPNEDYRRGWTKKRLNYSEDYLTNSMY